MDHIPGINCRICEKLSLKYVVIALLTAASLSGRQCDSTVHVYYMYACAYSEFAELYQRNLQIFLFAKKYTLEDLVLYGIHPTH